MSDTQAQEAVMPVIAYLRASKDGMPQWTEDCVCEYPVYPSDPDGSDEDCISMPMVRKADADAVIVSQAARIAELERELARMREPLSDEHRRAIGVCMEVGHVCVATVQRNLRIGWNRARDILVDLVQRGALDGLPLSAEFDGITKTGWGV